MTPSRRCFYHFFGVGVVLVFLTISAWAQSTRLYVHVKEQDGKPVNLSHYDVRVFDLTEDKLMFRDASSIAHIAQPAVKIGHTYAIMLHHNGSESGTDRVVGGATITVTKPKQKVTITLPNKPIDFQVDAGLIAKAIATKHPLFGGVKGVVYRLEDGERVMHYHNFLILRPAEDPSVYQDQLYRIGEGTYEIDFIKDGLVKKEDYEPVHRFRIRVTKDDIAAGKKNLTADQLQLIDESEASAADITN